MEHFQSQIDKGCKIDKIRRPGQAQLTSMGSEEIEKERREWEEKLAARMQLVSLHGSEKGGLEDRAVVLALDFQGGSRPEGGASELCHARIRSQRFRGLKTSVAHAMQCRIGRNACVIPCYFILGLN